MKTVYPFLIVILLAFGFTRCNEAPPTEPEVPKQVPRYELLGFESEIAFGEHLVQITGCDDCHSPKTFDENGMHPDMSRRLSGHPADVPIPDLDRKKIEKNGYAASNAFLTCWVGPWGVSFAANLTPDETGLGGWTKEQFTLAIRQGKYKGMAEGRGLLPPMPWFNYRHIRDDGLNAMFAYLQSIPPVDNQVPSPLPPVSPPPAPPAN